MLSRMAGARDCGSDRALRNRAHVADVGTNAVIVVVMGVCGCGKTTVGAGAGGGARLAVPRCRRFPSRRRTSPRWRRARRSTDADRWPWLDRLAARDGGDPRARRARGARVLGAEAGLPRSRSRARRATCASSISRATTTRSRRGSRARQHRYMPATLLASQFATLEEPRGRDRRRRARCRSPTQVARIRDALALGATRQSDAHEPRQATKPATQAGHLGRDPAQFLGAVNTPVFRASTMLFPTVADLEQAARGEYDGHRLRPARPADGHRPAGRGRGDRGRARRARGAVGAHRDDAAAAGARCKPGDHVLVTDAVYGPTRRFCDNHLTRLGVEVELLRSAGRARRSSASSGRTRASCSPSRRAR